MNKAQEENIIKLVPELPNEQPVKYHYTLGLLRKQAELTQQELAIALGVSLASIEAWENGRRNPSPENLQKLAEFYGVETEMIRKDAYTVEMAKQIVAEEVTMILQKGLNRSDKDRRFVLSVIKTLQPHILVEEKVTHRINSDGKQAYESAITKTQLHQEKKNSEHQEQ